MQDDSELPVGSFCPNCGKPIQISQRQLIEGTSVACDCGEIIKFPPEKHGDPTEPEHFVD